MGRDGGGGGGGREGGWGRWGEGGGREGVGEGVGEVESGETWGVWSLDSLGFEIQMLIAGFVRVTYGGGGQRGG